MQNHLLKAAVIAAWLLAVGSIGVGFGVASVAGWTALAILSVAPLAVASRLWGAPAASMSETIRDVLR